MPARRKALRRLNQSQFGPSPQEALRLIGQLADDLGRWLGSLDSAYGLAGPQCSCLDGTGRISIRHTAAKARYRSPRSIEAQEFTDELTLKSLGGRDARTQDPVRRVWPALGKRLRING